MIFRVPSHRRVFVLDDTEDRIAWFRQRLPNLRHTSTAEAALEILSSESFDLVFLDHDLHWMDAGFPDRLYGNGKEIARYLAYSKFSGRIVIHSRSDEAATMARILPQATPCPFGDLDISLSEVGTNGGLPPALF